MQRDVAQLSDHEFDLLVIGGGIYGVAAAWDATLRGLDVALVDKNDFGSGTSFNSAKTAHGGVRALQRGAVREMREYMAERRTLCRIAPHLVHPLPFLIPTFTVRQNRWLLRAYFALNDSLSRDRNEAIDPAKQLPPSRYISRDECLHLNPLVSPEGVTGGIIWHDCQIYNTDRMVLSYVLSACERGATAANYVEFTGWLRDKTRVFGISATDRVTGSPLEIRAKVILNVAGPWAHDLVEPLFPGRQNPIVSGLSKAMNLVTRRLTGVHAVAGSAGGRQLFAVPWREFSIVGTSHDPHRGGPDELTVRRNTVSRFIRDVREAFPGARLKLEDIRLVHRGFLPALTSSPQRVVLMKQSQIRDHRQDGRAGIITVVGVRYTTARRTAEHAIDAVFGVLGRPSPRPCETETTPLVGGDIDSFASFIEHAVSFDPNGIPTSTRRRLALSYGTTYRSILDITHTEEGTSAPLAEKCEVMRAEILHAVREEMAVKLADAVLRRTEAGSAGHPGPDALAAAARVMALELGWDEARTRRETDEVEQVYRIEEG